MTEEKSFLSKIKKWFSQDDVLPDNESDSPKAKASPRKAKKTKAGSRKAKPAKASSQNVKKAVSQKGKRRRDRSKRLINAYSIELKRTVTAEEADNLCNKNDNDAKLKFRCPEKSCKASVTCANMDTPKAKRKRAVYFVAIDDHSVGCKLRVK